jgi:uncharacterized protein (TIGR03083 family)
MSIDLGEMYRGARQRITGMVSDDVSDVPVPATPMWTVHDLVAHVTGVVADALSGNTEGAGSDPWTAAQVERCRDRSIADMVEEWSQGAPTIEGLLSSPAGEAVWRAVLDVHCHEADLLHALGRPVVLPDQFLDWVAPRMIDQFAGEVAGQGLAAVQVEVSSFELFRGRLGRRTADEVCAYSWSADPGPYLDAWFIFGRAEQSLGEVG